MKKLILSLLVVVSALSLSAKAHAADGAGSTDAYFINDQQVETLFAAGTDISIVNPDAYASLDPTGTVMAKKPENAMYRAADGNKNFVAALLLDLFLGGLGIHRLYLGTKTFTWVGYILTCGGIFGIVPLVDLVVLIVNNQDISPYVDNPKFFMW